MPGQIVSKKVNRLLAHEVAFLAGGTCVGRAGCGSLHCLRVEDCEIASAHGMGNCHGLQQLAGPLQGEAQCTHQSKGQQVVLARRTMTWLSKRE